MCLGACLILVVDIVIKRELLMAAEPKGRFRKCLLFSQDGKFDSDMTLTSKMPASPMSNPDVASQVGDGVTLSQDPRVNLSSRVMRFCAKAGNLCKKPSLPAGLVFV
jgi:hypothetical protein